jgi:hypothetical protein
MKQHRQLKIRRNFYIVLGSVLSAGCGASVYPASECKSPPPPLTVPTSPRSQCREVSTEHAAEWEAKYKEIQYAEENAVYWMRQAFIEMTEAKQKELKGDFATALNEINSADGKYLQLVDANAASKGDNSEAEKMLIEALKKFMGFFDEHLGAAVTQLPSGAQKAIVKARKKFQEVKDIISPTAAENGENAGASDEEGVIPGKKSDDDKDKGESSDDDKASDERSGDDDKASDDKASDDKRGGDKADKSGDDDKAGGGEKKKKKKAKKEEEE